MRTSSAASLFWDRWLFAVSVLLTGMGLVLALFPESLLFAPHTAALARRFSGGVLSPEAATVRAFLMGPLGGTIAGFYLLQCFIVRGPFRRREPWAWHAVLWATLLWFVVDGGMSLRHGAAFNIWMINVWPLLLVGLPLGMTYPAFRGRPSARRRRPGAGRRSPVLWSR